MADRDARISEIFYYFEQHTSIESGRTVGRKIGVVQEIICRDILLSSQILRDSMQYEPKIRGRSGASHKVEFVFFQPLEASIIKPGQNWTPNAVPGLRIDIIKVGNGAARIGLSYKSARERCTVRPGRFVGGTTILRVCGVDQFGVKVVDVDSAGVRLALVDFSRPRASVESKRVGAQRFSAGGKLGSGIQTIEKAKQASLVSVDFDFEYNSVPLPITGREAPRSYRSFVILGNGVHWTTHDRAILSTYVDYTYLMKDAAIIRYADYVRRLAANANQDFFPFFMQYFKGMTKNIPDGFNAEESDLAAIEPKDAPPIISTLERQMERYPVTIA